MSKLITVHHGIGKPLARGAVSQGLRSMLYRFVAWLWAKQRNSAPPAGATPTATMGICTWYSCTGVAAGAHTVCLLRRENFEVSMQQLVLM
jgi:hypothetical protein